MSYLLFNSWLIIRLYDIVSLFSRGMSKIITTSCSYRSPTTLRTNDDERPEAGRLLPLFVSSSVFEDPWARSNFRATYLPLHYRNETAPNFCGKIFGKKIAKNHT
jgi:hypothetical protein